MKHTQGLTISDLTGMTFTSTNGQKVKVIRQEPYAEYGISRFRRVIWIVQREDGEEWPMQDMDVRRRIGSKRNYDLGARPTKC